MIPSPAQRATPPGTTSTVRSLRAATGAVGARRRARGAGARTAAASRSGRDEEIVSRRRRASGLGYEPPRRSLARSQVEDPPPVGVDARRRTGDGEERLAVLPHERPHRGSGRRLREDRPRLEPHLGEVRLPDRLVHRHPAERHVRHLPEGGVELLQLARQLVGVLEDLGLERRVGLRDEGVHARDERPEPPELAPLLEHHEAQVVDHPHEVVDVLLRLAREPHLQVELQVREARPRDEPHLVAEHLVGDLLVDGSPEPLVARLGRDRERLLPLPGEDREELLGERVDLDRREGDVESEAREAVQDREDLGVVGHGGRDEADARGERPAALGDGEDARGRDPHLRGHRVGRPAEAAHLRAAAGHLDEELVRQLGVRRQDRRVRRLARRPFRAAELVDDDLPLVRRLGALAVDGRNVEPLERGEPFEHGGAREVRPSGRRRCRGRASRRRPS